MKDQDSVRFAEWWAETGSKIGGRFALAVATWEEAQKGLGVPLQTTPCTESVMGSQQLVKFLDSGTYYDTTEIQEYSCQGCVAYNNQRLCSEISNGTSCAEEQIIWIKKED